MMEVKTLKDLVYRAAELFGNETWVREAKKKDMVEHSYRQFKEDADKVGAWLEDKFADRVHAAVVGLTSYEYLVAWFGIQASGNVSVPLDCANNAEKIADEINRSDSEVLFLDDKHENDLDTFKSLCPKVKYYIHIHKKTDDMLYLGDIISEYKDKEPTKSSAESDVAAILFTSGTTGLSKGVMLSNGNLVDNATCEPDEGYHGFTRMTVLPVHHIFCFTCDILCSLWYGRTVCVNDSLMRIVKNLKIYRPTEVTFVPMIAGSILTRMNQLAQGGADKIAIGKEIFGENFRVMYTGGAYLSPKIIEGYREYGIKVSQGYGMTECSPRICTGVVDCPEPESVGRIVPHCEVKIVDGEIWVKSPSVMQGYYKNPEETAKSLTPDGWLMTGDLGYQKDGYVFITGRKKNLIILSNGENVSPEEIENQFAYFEPIKEIVVYDKQGLITAEVFPNPDYESSDIKAEIQAKIDEVNDKFPAAKHIVNLVIRDKEFEKTASRKIIRSSVTG